MRIIFNVKISQSTVGSISNTYIYSVTNDKTEVTEMGQNYK